MIAFCCFQAGDNVTIFAIKANSCCSKCRHWNCFYESGSIYRLYWNRLYKNNRKLTESYPVLSTIKYM